MKRLFYFYIWFAFLFLGIAFLYGGGQHFRTISPWYFLILKDVVWIVFLSVMSYIIYSLKKERLWNYEYRKFVKILASLIGVYVVIVLSHLGHKELPGLIQHELRNILFYMLIIPLVPVLFNKRDDFDFFALTLIRVGFVLSVFGIVSRYIRPEILTWNRRICSTMGDPTNFAIFLVLCLLILFAHWKRLGNRWSVTCLIVFSVAFVMANSLTALGTMFFGVFIFLVLRLGFFKGTLCSLAFVAGIFLISISIKAVENPDVLLNQSLLNDVHNPDYYLLDKAMRAVPTFKPSEKALLAWKDSITWKDPIRSTTNRIEQARFTMRYISEENYFNLLIGNFKGSKYRRFDNQYFNFIVNSGIISAGLFFAMFFWGALTGFKSYFRSNGNKDCLVSLNLALSAFLFSMVIVGFNGSALLNRFPLNFTLWLSLGMIFYLSDIITTKKNIGINL